MFRKKHLNEKSHFSSSCCGTNELLALDIVAQFACANVFAGYICDFALLQILERKHCVVQYKSAPHHLSIQLHDCTATKVKN